LEKLLAGAYRVLVVVAGLLEERDMMDAPLTPFTPMAVRGMPEPGAEGICDLRGSPAVSTRVLRFESGSETVSSREG